MNPESNDQPEARGLLRTIFVSPDEPRPRSGWRLLLHTALTSVLLFLFSVPIAILASLLGLLDANALLSAAALDSPLWLMGPVLGITAATWIARRFLDHRSFASLGFNWDQYSRDDLLFGILMPALLFALIFAFEWALGWIRFEPAPLEPRSVGSAVMGILGAAITYVIVGYQEELLSRGYHLQNLVAGLNLPLGVFFSSAIFAVLHASNPGASVMSTIGILFAGFFLAFAWMRTGKLWLSIGIHIGWNFFQGTIFGFAVSGTRGFHLLRHVVEGPALITGGAFGPEAGLTGMAAMGLGAYFVWRYTRGRSGVDFDGTSPGIPIIGDGSEPPSPDPNPGSDSI